MVEYHRVFAKKSFPPDYQLAGFYHPSECQKNGGLIFAAVAET